MPPFTWKERGKFLCWVAIMLLAIVLIVWMLFHSPGHRSIVPNQQSGAVFVPEDVEGS